MSLSLSHRVTRSLTRSSLIARTIVTHVASAAHTHREFFSLFMLRSFFLLFLVGIYIPSLFSRNAIERCQRRIDDETRRGAKSSFRAVFFRWSNVTTVKFVAEVRATGSSLSLSLLDMRDAHTETEINRLFARLPFVSTVSLLPGNVKATGGSARLSQRFLRPR